MRSKRTLSRVKDAPTLSRREQKKAEVREALVQAADVLFVEHGFEGTTVDQIAERAGVSRRTFFRYFPSKEAIAFPRSEERLEAFRAVLQQRFEHDTTFPAVRGACMEVGRHFVEASSEDRQRQRVIDASPTLLVAELEIFQAWEHAIAEAVAGTGDDEERRRLGKLFAAATIGVVRSTLREWYETDCEADILALADEVFDLLESGFAGRL